MMNRSSWKATAVPSGFAVVGLAALVWWTTLESHSFEPRVPGLDGAPSDAGDGTDGGAGTGPAEFEAIAGQPTAGPGTPSNVSGSWPWFRGPNRDAICDDGTSLARSWPSEGPPVLWQVELADGYAGAAISGGCVYVLDYVEPLDDPADGADPSATIGADTLRCLSLDDGREIWRNGYAVSIKPNHGITRTVPAVADDCVLTFGPRCHLACWDAATGENRWLVDMVRQYGAEERTWYNGQCLLVDGQRLIVAPGSPDCLMMALDYRTGEVIWKTPNPRGWKMTHSSITPLEFAGQSMYAYCGTGGTAGVSADDGSLLWDETQWKEVFATSPSPVPLPDGRLFLCSGYDKLGGMILTLQQTDGAFEVSEHAEIARKVFNSEQQTPVLYQGYLYGVKKLRGGQLLCMDLDGNEVWNSGDLKFGHGPYMIADGMVFALSEGGLLAIIEATPEGFQLLGQAQVLEDAHEAWGPMALVSGRLVLRDMHRMLCLDVR